MREIHHWIREHKPSPGVNGLALRKVVLAISTAILLLAGVSLGQRNPHFPLPPAPADPGQPQIAHKEESPKPSRPNPVDLERQGRELADLASSIPPDIQQVNKGLLPKDMADKLKRIEKLAKQLRGEIGR